MAFWRKRFHCSFWKGAVLSRIRGLIPCIASTTGPYDWRHYDIYLDEIERVAIRKEGARLFFSTSD
jgi:hypothetical protein